MMNEKEQLWYTRFLNYANSGMSRTHWCRGNGIAISSFRYWCKKFDAMRIDDMQEDTESAASGWYELSCSSNDLVAVMTVVKCLIRGDRICSSRKYK